MENNEIMNVEEIGMVEAGEKAGLSTGAAVGIGVGATLVAVAGVKLVKNLIAYFKAKKEQKQDDYVCVDEE